MTHTLRTRVRQPVAMYDALHAAVADTPGGDEGLLAHLAWETSDGFEIIEVWRSREDYDQFIAEVWPRVIERLGHGPIPAPEGEEFELRGLVLPAAESIHV